MRKESIYDRMTKREIHFLLLSTEERMDPKEIRKIHRALKKYGDGMPLWSRYPNFPTYISALSVVVSVIALLLT